MTATAATKWKRAIRSLKTPRKISLSEWSDTYRRLSTKTNYSGGRWRTDSQPFQREIMDTISDPFVREVVLRKSSQVGYSEILLNVVGYYIHIDPCPILIVQPTDQDAKNFSKERLATLIDTCPVLLERVVERKSRDSGNTIMVKEFDHGQVALTGAQTEGGLSARPVRILLLDEIDRYPQHTDKGGDPIGLAKARTTTFFNRKIIYGGSPNFDNPGGVNQRFLNSSCGFFHVPCPDCGKANPLIWANVSWGKDEKNKALPKTAKYKCPCCGSLWSDAQRYIALTKGSWIHENPNADVKGFSVNVLMSRFALPLSEYVQEWVSAQGDPAALQTFINTRLGEPWREIVERPDDQIIYERRSRTRSLGELEPGVMAVYAGIDVQGDRLEMSVWGFGKDSRRWLIDHQIFTGEPLNSNAECFQALNVALYATYKHPLGGQLPISKAAIDCGYRTEVVKDFAKKYHQSRLAVVKGSSTGKVGGGWLVQSPRAVSAKRGMKTIGRAKDSYYPINSSALKANFFDQLKIERFADSTPAGFIDLPMNIDHDFVKRLLNEALVKVKNSRNYWEWVFKKVVDKMSNEPLDCQSYARAAAIIDGIDRRSDDDLESYNEYLRNLPVEHYGATQNRYESKPKPPKKSDSGSFSTGFDGIGGNF